MVSVKKKEEIETREKVAKSAEKTKGETKTHDKFRFSQRRNENKELSKTMKKKVFFQIRWAIPENFLKLLISRTNLDGIPALVFRRLSPFGQVWNRLDGTGSLVNSDVETLDFTIRVPFTRIIYGDLVPFPKYWHNLHLAIDSIRVFFPDVQLVFAI